MTWCYTHAPLTIRSLYTIRRDFALFFVVMNQILIGMQVRSSIGPTFR
jgi:hypothetical protein